MNLHLVCIVVRTKCQGFIYVRDDKIFNSSTFDPLRHTIYGIYDWNELEPLCRIFFCLEKWHLAKCLHMPSVFAISLALVGVRYKKFNGRNHFASLKVANNIPRKTRVLFATFKLAKSGSTKPSKMTWFESCNVGCTFAFSKL